MRRRHKRDLKADRGHPLGLRINQQRSRRERDAIGHAAALACSRSAHSRPASRARQRQGAKLDQSPKSARRRAATHRPDNRRDGQSPSHSAVAAASLASPPPIQPQAKQTKATHEHRRAAASTCDSTSAPLIPLSSASSGKTADQNQRDAVGDRHRQQIARRGKRHHCRKQRQSDRFGQHGTAQLDVAPFAGLPRDG